MPSGPSFSDLPIPFQAFREPDFLGTMSKFPNLQGSHSWTKNFPSQKSQNFMHWSFSPILLFVLQAVVHIVIAKYTVHINPFVTDAYSHYFLWAKILLIGICLSGVFLVPVDDRGKGCPVLVQHILVIYLHYSPVSLQKYMLASQCWHFLVSFHMKELQYR